MPRSTKTIVVACALAAVMLVSAVVITVALTGGGHPATAGGAPGPSGSPAGSAAPAPGGTALCNSQRTAVDGGAYTVQNNEWGSGARQCLAVDGTGGFTVTTSAIANSTSGAPGGYPSIYRGCHWGACTRGSGLPVPVRRLVVPGAVSTGWATVQPGSGAYDVAYDIWFNQTPSTNGQPDGAELMIWLSHRGPVQPFGSRVGSTVIGGRRYDVWFGRQAWNTVSYSMVSRTTSVRVLDVGQVAADALRRGYIKKSWYLIDVEAGFELWQGGSGLATESFAVNVAGAPAAPGAACRPAVAAPPSASAPAAAPAVSCAVRYSVVRSWPGGFQAQVAVTNTGTSPISGWALAWAFPGGQRVTDMWNGSFAQSGERVGVTSASYDGNLAPAGSVVIGFIGTDAGSNAPPAAFWLDGTRCTG